MTTERPPLHIRILGILFIVSCLGAIIVFGYAFSRVDWKPIPPPDWLKDTDARTRKWK